MTLKPQLSLFALPEVWRLRRRWKEFLIWAALLYVPAFLVRPGWFSEWLAAIRQQSRPSLGWAASLWGVPPFLLIPICLLGVLAFRKALTLDWRPALLFLDPAIAAYDYSLLAGSTALLIPLSWLCQYIEIRYAVFWPWALTGLLAVLLSSRFRASVPPPGRFRRVLDQLLHGVARERIPAGPALEPQSAVSSPLGTPNPSDTRLPEK